MHSEERNPCNIDDRLCLICDDGVFINDKEIHNHLKAYGSTELQKNRSTSAFYQDCSDEQPPKKYLCERDEASTADARILRPFKCSLCELVFDRISQLDNHKRSVHHQERSHVCQICAKGFFRATDLKTHLNIHLGTNKCMCEVCGKNFNHVSNLIRHGRTHSGVKPYPCTTCGKRFTQINTLARHKAIHVRGNETLDCCFCNKKYKTKNGLKEHMKKLHGFTESYSKDCGKIMKRQHYCKVCGESFQFVELLRVHETIHQSIKMLECKSCNQKFKKLEEIKEHRCEKPNDSIDGDELTFEEITTDEELSLRLQISRTNEFISFNNDQLDPKLRRNVAFGNDRVTENKQTKETIVYVRAEQLGDMDTEQLVDTANNFLHEHLLELTTESNLQAGNMSSRDCENETVVSEMINNCWKEIEMSDVNELVVADKKILALAKHDTQNINHVEELENDGRTIVLNESDNLHDNISCRENSIDVKHEQSGIKNLVSNGKMRNGQSIKMINKHVKQSAVDFIQHEIPNRKLTVVKRSGNRLTDSVSYEKTSINYKEQTRKYKREPNTILKSRAEEETQNLRHNFASEDSPKDDNLTIGITTNALPNQNTFEELFRANMDNVNAVIAKTSENEEPTLRLVQTENIDHFYELLINKNNSERSTNSLELDKKISNEIIIDENLKTTQNDSTQESLLKLVQLENGQCVLELTENESDIVRVIESRIETDVIEKLSETETVGEGKNCSPNKSEKIIYLAQNSRDCLIDLFETETLCTQEANNFNSISDELMQTNFDHPQGLSVNKNLENANSLRTDNETCEDLFGMTQSSPIKCIKQNTGDGKMNRRDNGPMVRLVQNEDGAQFFELIRGDLEFEETQDFEFVKMNGADQEENCRLTSEVKNAYNSGVESVNDNDEKSKVEADAPRKKKLNTNGKKYNCDVCKKSFSKGYNYRQHIGTHFANQQKFKCKECGIYFAWKSTLNKHIASHKAGGQQKFVCEICPKVYTTLSQVNEHVKRDHLKERNHKCTHCTKTFFKKFDLKIHIRTHTKERPYECRVCYKSFHHQSHIIRHERIHSGERPYACNICEKAFTQLGSLKNHRQRHQELKIDILDYQMDEDDPLPQTTL